MAWLLLVATWLVLGCRPSAGALGRRPPRVRADTPTLGLFEPGALTGPRGSGLDLSTTVAGPPVPPEPEPLPQPRVDDYGPTAETSTTPTLEVRFNRPMVAFANEQVMTAAEAGFRIEPAIAGKASWPEPTRLVFEPEHELPLATEYQVEFERTIIAVDGASLDVDLSWSFATEAPALRMEVDERAEMPDAKSHWQASVGLWPTHELSLAQVRAHLRAEARDANSDRAPVEVEVVPFEPSVHGGYRWNPPSFWISPVQHWPPGREIVMTVDAGIRGELGPRPAGAATVYSFWTTPGVQIERECSRGEYDDGCELGPVKLELSSPITRTQAKYVRIRPEPKRFDALPTERGSDPTIEDDEEYNAYDSITLWGEFVRGQVYTVTVDKRLRDVYGQPLAGERSFELEFIEPPPSLSLYRGSGTFVATAAATIGLVSRHLETLEVRAALLDDSEYERLLDDRLEAWPAGVEVDAEIQVALQHTGAWGWSSHEFDLAQITHGGPAAVLIEVAPGPLLARARARAAPPAERGLVQITNLGITAIGSLTGGRVRVARLDDDEPVAGAEIELVHSPGGDRVVLGTTDAHGLLALPEAAQLGQHALLRAREGTDQVVLPIASLWHPANTGNPALRNGESVLTTLMTERPLYRPGERVRVMGWSSIATPYELSGLRLLPNKTKIHLELRNRRNEIVAETTVRAKPHGKFWATLELPEFGELGSHTLTATLLDRTFSTTIGVKDFSAPAFEVVSEPSQTDIHDGESTTIYVNAGYFFGGRVPITRVRHTTQCEAMRYRPPGLGPAFEVAPQPSTGIPTAGGPAPEVQVQPGPSASQGHIEYGLGLTTGAQGSAQRCTHAVAIADVSEREVGAESTIWAHPEFYLGVAAERLLVDGDDLAVDLETVDFDGRPVAVADVEVSLTRTWTEPEWETVDGKRRIARYRSHERALPTCTLRSEGSSSCAFPKLAFGHYTIDVTATHGSYQPTIRKQLWVSPTPGTTPTPPSPSLTVDVAPLDPVSGQTVHAVIRAPWSDGTGLILIAKGGLHELRPFTLRQGQADVSFEVTDAWIPGVSVHLVTVEPGHSGSTPRLRSFVSKVAVAPDSRRLSVSVQVQAEAQIRETIPIVVQVRDHLQRPVTGHVSVWAVDEAVLSLVPLQLPDFVEAFVVGFSGALDIVHGYGSLLKPFVMRPDDYTPVAFDPDWTRTTDSLIGRGDGGSTGGRGFGRGSGGGFGQRGVRTPPTSREQFDSAPIFIGDATLDADGVARVEGKLPDDLTTFRLTAVASAPLTGSEVEARFGTGDARVRVTRPMVVRAAMPRVMRPGDLAELGVIVDNLRGRAGTVDVELVVHGGDGILELLDPPTAEASIEVGGQLRIPFRIRALTAGTPEIELTAVMRPPTISGQPERVGGQIIGDALRLPLPIEPERTMTHRVALYGSLADDGAAQLPFVLPRDIDPNFGGMSVSVGSTLLGGVEDAVAYLVHYPHGCVEQTSSSLLPLIPLARLGEDYPLGIEDIDHYVTAGIVRLRSMQLSSGGFSYWPGGTEPVPYASAYATWVLGLAEAAGYPVPSTMLDDADGYLIRVVGKWEAVAGPSVEDDVQIAMLLAALAERGLAPPQALEQLYGRRKRLPVFAQALLLLALEADGRTQPRPEADPRIATLLAELRSVIDEREGVAKVELNERWTWYWDSPTRSSALVLMAMLRVTPDHPLVSKLARGLLDAREGGRWANTQENAYAVLALADYAAIYEAEQPRFDGRVWLGKTALADLHVEGRAFEFQDALTPMAELLASADRADERLILERVGQGRMYYRVGLEWATTAADKPAKAEGISLTRTLRDELGFVAHDRVVASGSRVAIDVRVEVAAALDHVAIEIPIPAGLELVDLALGRGSAAMRLAGERGRWVSHEQLRRDRAVVFADHLEPGVYTTTIFAHARTPGEYLMPAAHAEMMYYPEVYGRTTSRRLVVR